MGSRPRRAERFATGGARLMGKRKYTNLDVRGVVYPDVAAAAKALGVQQQTVHRAAREGRLHRLGLGRVGKECMPVRLNGRVYRDAHAAAADLGVGVSAVYQALHRGYETVGQRRRGGAGSRPIVIAGRRFASLAELDRAIGRSPGYTSNAIKLNRAGRLEDIIGRVMRLEVRA